MGITLNDNGYAVRLNVPLSNIVNSTALSSVVAVYNSSTTGTGIYTYSLPANATAGSYVLRWDMPALPYQIGNTPNGVSRGFQISDVTMDFTISSGSATSSNNDSTPVFTAWLYPASGFTDGASVSSAATAYGGSSSQWTFNWGGVVGQTTMPSSASSNMYSAVAVPGSGLNTWINTDNQRVTFEWSWNTGSTNYNKQISGITIHGNWRFGG